MDPELELIADYPCHTGENPLWHPDEQKVYWVDIPPGTLYRHDPATGENEVFEMGEAVGGFTLQEDGALLLFMARGGVREWREGRLRPVIEEIPEERDNRFNDVIADPEGRVFCGVMSTERRAGRLYRLDPDGALATLVEGVGTSNGLGFTPDGKGLYYTDSPRREIYLYDYDRATGAIDNRRVFVKVPEEESVRPEGKPDGLTVDAEGCVWSARWDGHCVVRYDPDGVEMRRLTFPTRKVSSVTFGGPDYSDLYATTAGGHERDANGATAGALYRLRPGVTGVPEFRSRVRVP